MSCVLTYLFTPGFILRCSSAIAADQMLLHPYLPYTYSKIYTPSYCSISKEINYSRGSSPENLSSILKLNHHSRDEVGAVVAKIAAFIAAFLGCYHKDNQGSKALF